MPRWMANNIWKIYICRKYLLLTTNWCALKAGFYMCLFISKSSSSSIRFRKRCELSESCYLIWCCYISWLIRIFRHFLLHNIAIILRWCNSSSLNWIRHFSLSSILRSIVSRRCFTSLGLYNWWLITNLQCLIHIFSSNLE